MPVPVPVPGPCLTDDDLLSLASGECEVPRRETLLAHARRCESCRELIAGTVVAIRERDDAELPSTIARYEIVRELGRGGMGIVYEAIDPRLGRRVAIKQLRAGVVDRQEDRLRAEARTLARLNHPNVVVVLEAGADHVVMELVDGEPLHAWQAGRSWRHVLAVYLDAGRGLAAAHAVGVVHRDFKPHNVLVGRDGRARVADFGLAAVRTATPPDDTDGDLTTSTALAGTPAYLAPERFVGRPADAASDQFSYCVALFEALAGVRPFPGDDVPALAAAVTAGDLRRRPATVRGVPTAVWRVIERGLCVDPRDRWPSMTAVVDALARAADRRRRWPMLAAGLVAALVVGGLLRADSSSPSLCRDDDRLAHVWNPARAREVEHALADSGLEYAAGTATRTVAHVDAWVQAWEDTRAELCAAPIAMEAPATCLENRRAVLAEVVERLGEGDRETVSRATGAAIRLPAPRDCLDHPRTVAATEAERDLVRTIETERTTIQLGVSPGDLPRLESLVARADATSDPLLGAEARLVCGTALGLLARWPEAQPWLEGAYFRAYENGGDLIALDAARNHALGLMWLGEYDDALAWVRRGRAATTDPIELAHLANVESDVLFSLGRLDDAEAALADALAVEAPVAARASGLTMLATLRTAQERFAEAETIVLEAVELVEREAGPHHPDLARSLNILGIARMQLENPRGAIAVLERARALLEAQLGEHHVLVGQIVGNIAVAHGALGEHDVAYERLLRVLDIFERESDGDDLRVAITEHNLANQAMLCHRPADALRHATRALAIKAGDGIPENEDSISTVSLLARARAGVGDFEGSLAAWDELLAKRHAVTPDYDDALGWAELETAITAESAGLVPRARSHIARALAHYERSAGDTSPREHARVHVVAARLAEEHDVASDHLRRAWTYVAASTVPRESASRLAIAATWAQLGGAALAPWSAIGSS